METEAIQGSFKEATVSGKGSTSSLRRDNAQVAYLLQTLGTTKLFAPSGSVIRVRSRRGLALLLILALTEGHAVTRRRMASWLWSRNPDRALQNLRHTLHELKQDLMAASVHEPLVVVEDKHLMIPKGALVADVVALERSDVFQTSKFSTIGADLEGIDTAFDAWLVEGRSLFAAPQAGRPVSGPGDPSSPRQSKVFRQGAVIGIAPFEKFGFGVNHEYLPYALVGQIEESLALIRGLIVISSASIAIALAAGTDLKHEFGLDFLVRGRVEGVSVLSAAFQLIDMERQSIVWTTKFIAAGNDMFAFKNHVASSIAAAFEPVIPHILGEQLRNKKAVDGSTYDLLLAAIAGINSLEKSVFLESGNLLDQAIAKDPNFAAAFSWKSLWGIFLVGQGWAANVEEATLRAGVAADRAISLDPYDARSLTVAGHVQAFLYGRHDQAMMLHKQALAINPSLSLAWHLSGVCYIYNGELTHARLQLERCSQLEPVGRHSFFREGAQLLLELLSKDYTAAVSLGRRLTKLHPNFTMPYKVYLSAAGHLGLVDEASSVYTRLLEVEPSFDLQMFRASLRYTDQAHVDIYIEGLKLAGVREAAFGHSRPFDEGGS